MRIPLILPSEEVSFCQGEAALVLRPREAARVEWSWRRHASDGELYRLWGIFRVGVEGVLAGVEHHQDVHLGAQFHKVARLRVVRLELHAAVLAHSDAAEKVYVWNEVPWAQPPLTEFHQKAI